MKIKAKKGNYRTRKIELQQIFWVYSTFLKSKYRHFRKEGKKLRGVENTSSVWEFPHFTGIFALTNGTRTNDLVLPGRKTSRTVLFITPESIPSTSSLVGFAVPSCSYR